MQTLEQWLEVATHDLCESATERVRAEISEHYQSAVEAAGAAADPLDVERQAVAALGDARTANRDYRRVLLTESEAKLLRDITSFGPHHVIGILLLAATAVYAISVRTSEFNYLFGAVALLWATYSLPIRSNRTRWIVGISGWVGHAAFYTTWFMRLDPMGSFMLILMLLMPLGIAHTEYRLFVIRRKLPIAQWPRRLWV